VADKHHISQVSTFDLANDVIDRVGKTQAPRIVPQGETGHGEGEYAVASCAYPLTDGMPTPTAMPNTRNEHEVHGVSRYYADGAQSN